MSERKIRSTALKIAEPPTNCLSKIPLSPIFPSPFEFCPLSARVLSLFKVSAMVTPPLSTCPVVFVAVPEAKLSDRNGSVFNMLPFTNNTWRGWCGLAPLTGEETREDEAGGGSGGQSDVVTENQAVRWLTITDEGYRSLKAKVGWRKPSELVKVGTVLGELRRRALVDREGCLRRVTHVPNYKVFASHMLAMLNRRGGVMEEINKVMEQQKHSVKHLWLDQFDINSVCFKCLQLQSVKHIHTCFLEFAQGNASATGRTQDPSSRRHE